MDTLRSAGSELGVGNGDTNLPYRLRHLTVRKTRDPGDEEDQHERDSARAAGM